MVWFVVCFRVWSFNVYPVCWLSDSLHLPSLARYLQFDFACLRHCLIKLKRAPRSISSHQGPLVLRLCGLCRRKKRQSIHFFMFLANREENMSWLSSDMVQRARKISGIGLLLLTFALCFWSWSFPIQSFYCVWSLSHFMESSLMDMVDNACRV